jgi:hypothetical protein
MPAHAKKCAGVNGSLTLGGQNDKTGRGIGPGRFNVRSLTMPKRRSILVLIVVIGRLRVKIIIKLR